MFKSLVHIRAELANQNILNLGVQKLRVSGLINTIKTMSKVATASVAEGKYVTQEQAQEENRKWPNYGVTGYFSVGEKGELFVAICGKDGDVIEFNKMEKVWIPLSRQQST